MDSKYNFYFTSATRRETLFAIYSRYLYFIPPLILLTYFRHQLPFPFPHLPMISLVGAIINGISHYIVYARPGSIHTQFMVHTYIEACYAPFLFCFSGGFLSPFVIANFGSAMSGAMVYSSNKKFGYSITGIITISYLSVSLLQKYGVVENYVEYSRVMMANDSFFYFVIATVASLFAAGPMIVASMFERKIGEIAHAYQLVSEGTSLYKGRHLFPAVAKSLALLLSVEKVLIGIITKDKKSLKVIALWDKSHCFRKPFYLAINENEFIYRSLNSIRSVQIENMTAPIVPDSAPDPEQKEDIPLNFAGIALRNTKRQPIGLIGLFHDKSNENQIIQEKVLQIFASRAEAELERLRAEREKIKMQKRLLQGQKMEAIGKLAGGIAHDFNNHLSAILGYCHLIKKKSDTESAIYEYASKIITVSNRSADLISKLLSYARRDSFAIVDVDMHTLIKEIGNIIQHTSKHTTQVSLKLNAAYPTIKGNSAQLSNMLLNICVNAIDAMAVGGGLTISTENRTIDEPTFLKHAPFKSLPSRDYLCIKISDTGTGIDEKVLPHIFEPFFTTKPSGKGTGLGLAAVYGCVKAHKGYIDVESTVGVGSTFIVYMPFDLDDQTVKQLTVDSPEKEMDRRVVGSLLIVDDDIFITDILKNSLADFGFSIAVYNSAKEALDFYSQNWADINLAIIDMVMPEIGGVDLFKNFKRINPNIKAIVLSGYSEGEKIQQILDDGVLEHIFKPVQIPELCKIIEKHLDSLKMST
ncbi:MAG: response regulator [Chitinivibrionales bacterium]|nr:response regulator [Chitinivibrionales bacterium]